VVVDPNDPAHILVGAAGGGVWETRDTGLTWSPRTDDQPSLATGAIAFDPANPSLVYAGTGEGDAFWWLGAGLLRSTDGGTTWAVWSTQHFQRVGFHAIIVDPLDSTHLLAATRSAPANFPNPADNGGIYESFDAGQTWAGRRVVNTRGLSMHPPVPGNAASTREVFAGCEDGLFVSSDGGTMWTPVPLPNAPTDWARIAVAHAPSNGDIVYVFGCGMGANSRPEANAHLWRRTSTAGGFVEIALPPSLNTVQATYDWYVACSPNDPSRVYLGAISLHEGIETSPGVFSWSVISDVIHADQHAIAFDSTNPLVFYAANDGGIYATGDGGASWRSLNKGLSITEFEYIAQHPRYDTWIIGGTQDNGTLVYNGGSVWYLGLGSDGGDCAVNDQAPHQCFASMQVAPTINYPMAVWKSGRAGEFPSFNPTGPPVPPNYEALFYPPLEARGPILAQAGTSVFISEDAGITWQPDLAIPQTGFVPPNPPPTRASALTIAASDRLYVGTTDGNVYRISKVGAVWQAPVALAKPRLGWVSCLLEDPLNPNKIWATYYDLTGSHVFRSDNAGVSWNDVSAGLPPSTVASIAKGPVNDVFVAAERGVFRSPDDGAHWVPFSNLLPNALVKDLHYQSATGLLRAATLSRGVWEIDANLPTMPDVELYVRDSAVDSGRQTPAPSGVENPFVPGELSFWWQCVDIKVDAAPFVRPNMNEVDFEVFADDHGFAFQGLQHDDAPRSQAVRVYVQVHNRGPVPASNVSVKVFFADASLALPDLPATFWSGFPSNALPAGSPWQQVAPHQTKPLLQCGQPEVFGFDWSVPMSAADHTCLLAVVTADNDQIPTNEFRIGDLVTLQPKCGLRNVRVTWVPSAPGTPSAAPIDLWGINGGGKYGIETDGKPPRELRAVLFSHRLAEIADAQGVPRVQLDETDRLALARILRHRPSLREELQIDLAFRPWSRRWLDAVELSPDAPERLVLIADRRQARRSWSLLQKEGEVAVGGYTFEVKRRRVSRDLPPEQRKGR
jgi:photosystem II stability/assembly factor-like uncharacterized protein